MPELLGPRIGLEFVKYCFKSNHSDHNLEILDRQIIIRNTVESPLNLM